MYPVSAGAAPAAPLPFAIYFRQGGAGTFLPLFYTLLQSARTASRAAAAGEPTPRPPDVASIVRTAYVDPADPSIIFIPAK